MLSPISPLFSGWNWQPNTLPEATAAVSDAITAVAAESAAAEALAGEAVCAAGETGGVAAIHSWQPDFSFRLAVYGMSVFVILLGVLAVPVMKLITAGVALL